MFMKKNISKVLYIEAGFLFVLFAIVLRLFYVQVIMAEHYRQIANIQHRERIDIPPKRSDIYDREGRILATNKRIEDFYAIKYLVTDIGKVDSVFCHHFGESRGYYADKIEKSSTFVFLKRGVELDIANQIIDLNLHGVEHQQSYRRVYPYGSCGAQVIGFCNIDNKGIEGLEKFYDDRLCGVPGQSIIFKDGKGHANPLLSYGGEEPIPGQDIVISIDIEFQSVVEKALADAVDINKAVSGFAVFLDPKSGQVLAMASNPTFHPEHIGDFPALYRKNRTITDVLEPGSIFKVVTYSVALEDSNFSTEDSIFCERGVYTTKYRVIRDEHEMEWASLKDVIVESSNIGIIKLAGMLDNSLIYDRIQQFGFGTVTGIDLEGEVGGTLHPLDTWTPYTDLALPMGYEISLTPLQIANAYGAIANGGWLMQPYLATEFHQYGLTVEKRKPIKVRRIVDEDTDSILIETLTEVVERGTAKRIKIDGIPMAGKTGTAKKPRLDGGGYWQDKFIGTFVGFAPADNPQVVGVISIDTPQGKYYYGGLVAGPAFRQIVQRAANMGIIDVQPDSSKLLCHSRNNSFVRMPDIRRMTLPQAERVLEARGLIPEVAGSGIHVTLQSPMPEATVPAGTIVKVVVDDIPDLKRESREIPDIYGLSMRDAIARLSQAGIEFRLIGSGSVVETIPARFEEVKTGEKVLVELR